MILGKLTTTIAALALTLVCLAAPAFAVTSAPASDPDVETDGRSALVAARLIHFKNGCDAPIEAAIRFETLEGRWEVSEWITLEPDETRPVAKTRAGRFFSTARSASDGQALSPEGALWAIPRGSMDPVGFGMRRISKRFGDEVTQIFFCPR